MPLQIRATPPPLARRCARQFKRTVRLSSLSHFFLISLFHVCLVPRSLLPPQPRRGRAIPSSAPSRVSYKEKERRRRERETRENPLRNVFGPCAARYYLQSRAYIKYTCREEKGHDEKRERESFSERPRYENAHDDELRTKSGGRLIFKFSRFNYASRVFSYLSVCLLLFRDEYV